MARGNVRTHTRRTKDGKTTTVRQHSRRHQGGRGVVRPGRAWRNAKRAVRAMRQRKRLTAAMFATLALGELSVWAALRGVGALLATAGILALGVAFLAAMASGVDL